MDEIEEKIRKFNKHNYDIQALNKDKQCTKIINDELSLLH